MPNIRVGGVAVVALLAVGCAPTPQQQERAGMSRQSLIRHEWELVALGEQADPLGAGGRRPTIRFTDDDGRAAGFGGCNRWSAAYALSGDSLTFGPPVATKMACSEGMALETAFFAMLPGVRRYEATDTALTLLAGDAPVARFRAAAP
jgi:putative lipoprotein